MSNEIQLTANLQYVNAAQNISAKSLSIQPLSPFSIVGKEYTQGMMSVPVTSGGTAIPVSALANVGWAFFKNNDATNYVDIMSAVSGTLMHRLLPGEPAMFRFNPAITAPAAIAHTAAVNLEFLILEI